MEPCAAAMRGDPKPAPAKGGEPWRSDFDAWIKEFRNVRQPLRVAVADQQPFPPNAIERVRQLWAAATAIADANVGKDMSDCVGAADIAMQLLEDGPAVRAADRLTLIESSLRICERTFKRH